MSLESDGAIFESPTSDESRTQLYDRTCGGTARGDPGGGREKRARSPDFIPGKLRRQDALRLPFVDNKKIIMANCSNHLAAVDGAPAIAGLESALTAWVATPGSGPRPVLRLSLASFSARPA